MTTMTFRDAFVTLRQRVYEIQKIPLGATTQAERTEEAALIIALEAMHDWSGSFSPDEWVIGEKLPTRREVSDVPTPPPQRSCNRHADCDASDAKAKAAGLGQAEHCFDSDCEDCFGR